MLVHHMVEYVIREGPMFEAMIMNKEINNPLFRFLFDNQSPAHVYYRWKLFSLLQGDTQKDWRQKEFRMFKGGSIWRPPPPSLYTQGMPEELIEKDDDRKGGLSPAQRDRLEQLIRHMTPERMKIADAMVFCIEHAEAADEICDCILESISNSDTLLHKKVARLYLVSDILHNCSIKMTNASNYRRCLEARLVEVMNQAHQTLTSLESRLKAEGFKQRVLKIFKAWEDWAVYPRDFLLRLRATFLGTPEAEIESSPERDDEGDIDGLPCEADDGDDLDGVPLDGAALLRGAIMQQVSKLDSDDIDGIPMEDDDIDGKPLDASPKTKKSAGAFVPSKWEEVDPELIEEQAMTTSKWEMMEQQQQKLKQQIQQAALAPGNVSPQEETLADDSVDSCRDLQEEIRRAKLREIEVKVVQYQDEIESGKRPLKPGWTVADQIEHHRKKLLRKSDKNAKPVKDKPVTDKLARRSLTPDDTESRSYKRTKRSKSSSPSPPPSKRSTHRSRSRSPYGSESSRRRKRSKSPSSRRASPSSRKGSPRRRLSPKRSRRGGSSPDLTPRRQRRGSSGENTPTHSSSSSHKKHSSRHKHKHRH